MSKLPGMAKPPMRNRTVKVSDDIWDAAKAKADRQAQNISDVVRAALEAYVNSPDKERPTR